MADFNLNNIGAPIEEVVEAPVVISPTPVATDNTNEVEEINSDIATIEVSITDKKTPIVILFGSPACGKTMTLIRLTRYLQKNGYTVQPNKSFRAANDKAYQNLCDHFDELVNNQYAAESTSKINFMLVNIIKKGKTICQIMEAPGEGYFNPDSPKDPFPPYVEDVINSDNRKVWVVMVEPTHTNKRMPKESDRLNYVTKIHELNRKMSRRDRVLFLYNKIDQTPYVQSKGVVSIGPAIQGLKDSYPNILNPFRNNMPIISLFKKYTCGFVPFQSGEYYETTDNRITFRQGSDIFPKNLWNSIIKFVRG